MTNSLSRPLAWLAALSLVAVVFGTPSTSFAADPSIVESETVANVTAGADNTQALATTSNTANVAEVKAQRVIEVASLPVNGESFLIGSCTVSFATTTAGSPAQDLNCTGGATVNVATTSNDRAKTAAEIATDIASLTNVTATGHGALSVATTSSIRVSFTTSGTEASATNIAFTDSTSGNITSIVDTTGVIPVAQVWRVTPSNVEVGDIFTTIINGTTISFTATTTTVAGVTLGLTTAINASAQASNVTASNQTTRVDVTADTAGTAFTLTSSATNKPAVAQTVTFTPTDVVTADYNVTINGILYSVGVLATGVQSVVEALAPVVDASADVSCSEDDTKVTCVAASAGTSFTYSSSVTNFEVHSGGNGGGSSSSSRRSSSGGSSRSSEHTSASSNSSSAPASVESRIADLMARIAELKAQEGGVQTSAFARDLELGATGADVKALQQYLNAHGAVIASEGPGSAGNETERFGALTQAALIKFQTAAGITPASGYFGPKTRAYVSSH